MAATVLTGAGNVTVATSGAAASIAPAKPANLADGHYMLAFAYFRNSGGTITPPSGWTQLGPLNTTNETFAAYYKKVASAAAESGASTYTWSTSAGSSRAIGIIALVTGADPTTFQDAAGALAAYTGTSSVVLPAVTASAAGKQLLAFVIGNNTTTGSPSAVSPAGAMTTVASGTADNGTTATATIWIGQETLAASGSSGTRSPTFSPAAGNSGGFMVTINGTNQPPTVPPIADQIKAAGATATVTAVPSDPDGTIASHLWTVDKAPFGTTAPALTNATTATVSVAALSVGTTRLKYVATDNSGATSTPVYMRLIVPAASTVGAKPEQLISNGGGWTLGGTATDAVDGLSGSGKWLVGPAGPSGAEITLRMEAPSTGTHTVQFYADWLDNDGTTQASGVSGTFTAQVFQSGVAISTVKSGSNLTNAPVALTFTMLTGEDTSINADTAHIEIQIKATQA